MKKLTYPLLISKVGIVLVVDFALLKLLPTLPALICINLFSLVLLFLYAFSEKQRGNHRMYRLLLTAVIIASVLFVYIFLKSFLG